MDDDLEKRIEWWKTKGFFWLIMFGGLTYILSRMFMMLGQELLAFISGLLVAADVMFLFGVLQVYLEWVQHRERVCSVYTD